MTIISIAGYLYYCSEIICYTYLDTWSEMRDRLVAEGCKFHLVYETSSKLSTYVSSLYFRLSLVFSVFRNITVICGPGSSVGIATELQAGRSGIESLWGRDFPSVQTGPGAHPVSSKMGTGSMPGVKCGQGVLLTTYPLLVPRSCKSRAIPLPKFWTTPGL